MISCTVRTLPQGMQYAWRKSVMLIFVTIVQLLVGLVLATMILFQSGKSRGLSGAIGGIADSYMAKSKAKSLDAKLARATKWVGALFVVLTLIINCMVAAGM